eukprot:TRINITY_DN2302_c0_g1_i1.p1 TRINITY_DN2302_c0_g1~~TRINITY_DN2302_c0_g1_i1.p1  ORF type:complete len:336 (-),score=80.41 TRINITY_DN2302_c0_g1_i1:117-1124(-)
MSYDSDYEENFLTTEQLLKNEYNTSSDESDDEFELRDFVEISEDYELKKVKENLHETEQLSKLQITNEIEKRRRNTQCFFAICAIILILIVTLPTLYLIWPRNTVIYDHNMVHVDIPPRKCLLNSTCETDGRECTQLENSLGCCVGCPIEKEPQCGLNVTISWHQVPLSKDKQRIWLLVTQDGYHWYSTGFAPYVTGNPNYDRNDNRSVVSGVHSVTDGCYGNPYNYISVVACLSTYDLNERNFFNFPIQLCNSTYGVCFSTDNVAVDPIRVCPNNVWEGNNFISEWDTKEWDSRKLSPSSAGVESLFQYNFFFNSQFVNIYFIFIISYFLFMIL